MHLLFNFSWLTMYFYNWITNFVRMHTMYYICLQSNFSLLRLCLFLSSLMFTTKLRERYRDFLYTPCIVYCVHMHSLPIINIPQSGTLIPIKVPTLTYHNHLKFIVYISINSWYYAFYQFRKMIMICIHHYNIIQSIITALKSFVLYSFPPLTHN